MDEVPPDWLQAVYDRWGRDSRVGDDGLSPGFRFTASHEPADTSTPTGCVTSGGGSSRLPQPQEGIATVVTNTPEHMGFPYAHRSIS